ncbi:MAG: glycoside hydrolase family 18 protein [Saprospiraceae bacterium]
MGFRFSVIILTLLPLFSAAQPCREVIAYFPSWKWYHRDFLVNPATIDYSKYTAINYAFFQPRKDGSITPFDPLADKTLLLGEIKATAPRGYARWKGLGTPQWHQRQTSLVSKAHANGVKVLISVGGWTLSKYFSGIAGSESKRHRFAHSCNELVRTYGIDGIDIDWEYPGYAANHGRPTDGRNFTLLLQTIRDSLDILEKQTGRQLLLTAAFGVAPTRMDDIEWSSVTPLLDFINLMTYDFYGNNFSVTNHHAPLFAPKQGIDGYDLNSVVQYLTDNYGVPAGKINVGVAFYGRSLKTKKDPGLYVASRKVPDTSTFPDGKGAPPFYTIIAQQRRFNYHWDHEAQAPYLQGKKPLHTFVSFDDENSVARKARYILGHGLAGAIVWDITGDYVESRPGSNKVAWTPLAKALSDALCNRWVFDDDIDPLSLFSLRPAEKLPMFWVPVYHRTYVPQLPYDIHPVLSKKEIRRLKKQRKRAQRKQRKKKKPGLPDQYFDGSW